MDSFINLVRSALGIPPIGYEWLEYIFSGFLLFFVLFSVYFLVASVFRIFGGGRRA